MSKQLFVGEYEKEQRNLELDQKGDGRYVVSIDGQKHEVDARHFEGGTWSLIIDGRSYDVELEVAGQNESEGHYVALIRGSVIKLSMQDERKNRLRFQDKIGVGDGPQVITSPMPGKIVKILVKEEQEVVENQPIIIIEAMKMENELRAIKDGIVTKIMVEEGQTVVGNSKLIAIA
jgi:biotin carboxyl carrier protein